MNQNNYRRIFAHDTFRTFWFSFTLSVIGDSMSRVTLTWFVFSLTKSPEALGLLTLTYTAPIIIGGLLAGPLLDRFDRRKVMIFDNVIRGCAMLFIPLLYALGELQLWHIYLISSIYGFFVMFSLAGGPSLVPDMVDESDLDTANALETISYTIASVVGPPIAGFLIPVLGAPNIIILDVLSYFLFAFALFGIHVQPHRTTAPSQSESGGESFGLGHAIRLLLDNKILLSTTLMFMAANIGLGTLSVWLPLMTERVFNGGPQLYGLLLGAVAVGEVISAVVTGAVRMPLPLGTMICLGQILAGIALAVLVFTPPVAIALIALASMGFVSAPLTIWAQTLRMKIIPPHLRGRTFALLRTMMQGTTPLGGAFAGFVVPILSISGVVLAASFVIGIPGLLGYSIRELRTAD